MQHSITVVTRRNINEELRRNNCDWSGRLDELEFLSRIYRLEKLPSQDRRFKNAAEDIWQHRINNPDDWPDDWIFDDERFDLLNCDDDEFVKFISEMLHPEVLSSLTEVDELLLLFNTHLSKDGWALEENSRISDRPVFTGVRVPIHHKTVTVTSLSTWGNIMHKSEFWEDGFFRIFLSHKVDEKVYAAELKEALLRFGITSFVAHEDIKPTKKWEEEIESALFSADALVAIMTKSFHESEWTDQEVGVAYGRNIPVISIKLERDPYGFIGKFQAVNGNKDNKRRSQSELAKELFRLMLESESTRDKMQLALVTRFEQAIDYYHANALMELIPLITTPTKDIVDRLENAPLNNNQLSGANRVKESLKWRISELRKLLE